MADPTIAVPARLAGPVSVVLADGEKIVYTVTGTGILGAIIKVIRFTMPTGTAQSVGWGILPVGQTPGTGSRMLLEDMVLQDQDPVTDEPHHYLAPGDRIIVMAGGAGATVTISGVLLK